MNYDPGDAVSDAERDEFARLFGAADMEDLHRQLDARR